MATIASSPYTAMSGSLLVVAMAPFLLLGAEACDPLLALSGDAIRPEPQQSLESPSGRSVEPAAYYCSRSLAITRPVTSGVSSLSSDTSLVYSKFFRSL